MSSRLSVSIATMSIKRCGGLVDLVAHITSLATTAKERGSRLLVLPELTCVGLLWSDAEAENVDVTKVAAFYRKVLSPLFPEYCAALSGIAVSHDMVIAGASYWHEENGVGINTAFVFTPDGKMLRQEKLHPTRGERAIATLGGNGLTTFELDGVKLGLIVCYDVQFPEVTQTLVRQGVEVLLVPSLTDERGTMRVWHSAHARALENQMYVCVSPLSGDLGIPFDHPVRAMGQAFVACPIDNRFGIEDGTYALAGDGSGELLTTELDLDKLRLSRAKAEVRQLADRRPDLYARLEMAAKQPATL